MGLSQSDLVFVLSGGINNDLPEKSLGGYPSPVPITDELQNLFATLEPREVSDGKIDYRCFYIFNDNPTDSFYHMQVWIQKLDDSAGSLIEMGLSARDESQHLALSPATGATGTFRLKLDNQTTDLISFHPSGTTLAINIQTALAALDNLEDTTVVNNTVNEYTIYFTGASGNRAISLLAVDENLITPTCSIVPSRLQNGSPINTVATLINNELEEPANVSFSSGVKPGVLLGTLRPSEGFPVWIKRTTAAGTGKVESDGFKLVCKVTSSL